MAATKAGARPAHFGGCSSAPPSRPGMATLAKVWGLCSRDALNPYLAAVCIAFKTKGDLELGVEGDRRAFNP
jgi:hypothetical protein